MLEAPLLAAFILAVAPAAAQTSSVERHQLDEAQQAYERGQELMRAESFEEAAIHFRTADRAGPDALARSLQPGPDADGAQALP